MTPRKLFLLAAIVCCLVAVLIDSGAANWQHPVAWLAAGVGLYLAGEVVG